MDGKAWQTSTEAQAGKGPQREREKEEGVVVWGEINGGMVRGGHPPNQSESWQFNYKEIKDIHHSIRHLSGLTKEENF